MSFTLSVLIMAFSNTVAVQFPDLRSGAAKRQFALAARYWVDTCFWLLLTVFVSESLALFFLGATYFPSSCGSAQLTASTLQAANATLDGEGSPCVSFVGEQITYAGGAVMCTIVVSSFLATMVHMRPSLFACPRDPCRGQGRACHLCLCLAKLTSQHRLRREREERMEQQQQQQQLYRPRARGSARFELPLPPCLQCDLPCLRGSRRRRASTLSLFDGPPPVGRFRVCSGFLSCRKCRRSHRHDHHNLSHDHHHHHNLGISSSGSGSSSVGSNQSPSYSKGMSSTAVVLVGQVSS